MTFPATEMLQGKRRDVGNAGTRVIGTGSINLYHATR